MEVRQAIAKYLEDVFGIEFKDGKWMGYPEELHSYLYWFDDIGEVSLSICIYEDVVDVLVEEKGEMDVYEIPLSGYQSIESDSFLDLLLLIKDAVNNFYWALIEIGQQNPTEQSNS